MWGNLLLSFFVSQDCVSLVECVIIGFFCVFLTFVDMQAHSSMFIFFLPFINTIPHHTLRLPLTQSRV